jgi:hypothetical protein
MPLGLGTSDNILEGRDKVQHMGRVKDCMTQSRGGIACDT